MKVSSGIKNDLILRVARGERVERPPVWVMRQAGRYLDEYQAVRKQAGGFREMIAHPEYAAEVTLQPIDILGVDAAIIFSDILVIPEAIGLPYEIEPGTGPYFSDTVRSKADLDKLHPIEERSNLDHTYEAIKMVKRDLDGRVPLIGFAGAPWTIFSYMVEGKGSKTFSMAKSMLYKEPELAHDILNRITDATIIYLKEQIKAGADLIQIFDSWAGVLHRNAFETFALPYIKKICESVSEVPRIVFAKGAWYAMESLADLDCEVIGLDWTMPPAWASHHITRQALQGNLDPCQLYASTEDVIRATNEMLSAFPAGRHIANLGHGVYPDMPRQNVKAFVDTVKAFHYQEIQA